MVNQSGNPDIVIQVTNLAKVYNTSGKQKGDSDTLSDDFISGQRHTSSDSFVALDNLSFELFRGDVLGIIGKNGSGKSTLLKILSEVIPPTSGEVRIKGQVASLLEVGTGFHPDISGRENIFMNGILLGMDKDTIRKKFDEIVHFSGISEFIDVPVKKYSSGMFLRLAFSVMVSLDNTIILLDEILSVGDAEFRLKSYNRIKSFRGTDKTIVIVSHDLGAISDLCNKCLVLEKGKLAHYGETTAILSGYMEKAMINFQDERIEDAKRLAAQSEGRTLENVREKGEGKLQTFIDFSDSQAGPGSKDFRIMKMSVSARGKSINTPIMMDDEIEISITYQKNINEITVPGLLISSPLSGTIMALTSERPSGDSTYFNDQGVGQFTSVCTVPASFLNAGVYSITLYYNLLDEEDTLVLNWDDALNFKVNYAAYNIPPSNFVYKGRFRGPIYPLSNWKIHKISD